MSDEVTLSDIQLELLHIEARMNDLGVWNQHERWKSGRFLIAMRNPATRYLPKGRLTTVAETLKVSTRELSDRMRVADAYRTDAAFRKAATGKSWTAILRDLPPAREARTGPTRTRKDIWQRLFNLLGQLVAFPRGTDPERMRLVQRLYDYLRDSIDAVEDEDQDDDDLEDTPPPQPQERRGTAKR